MSARSVDRLAFRLLGRHVGRRAEHDAERGRPVGERGRVVGIGATAHDGRKCLREAEVQHLHGAVVLDLDVGRLEIAVDDA
jgi:hypothetical protein